MTVLINYLLLDECCVFVSNVWSCEVKNGSYKLIVHKIFEKETR